MCTPGRSYLLLLAVAALTLGGCNEASELLGSERNRNADLDLELGATTLRGRVIEFFTYITPAVFSDESPGDPERYRLQLFYSTDEGTNWTPATLLSPSEISNEIVGDYPIGLESKVSFIWDRDRDIDAEVQANVQFQVVAEQVINGQGRAVITKGPRELDTRASGDCSAPAPQLTINTITVPRNEEVDVAIQVDGGDAPLRWYINETLPEGLSFTEDGRITGRSNRALTLLRLVAVSDDCAKRFDAEWVTIRIQ